MKKEKKKLYVIDIVEMIISIIGVITFSTMFMVINTKQKIMFFIATLYFACNTFDMIREIIEIRKSEKISKYSKKEISGKEKRKLSY